MHTANSTDHLTACTLQSILTLSGPYSDSVNTGHEFNYIHYKCKPITNTSSLRECAIQILDGTEDKTIFGTEPPDATGYRQTSLVDCGGDKAVHAAVLI